MIQDRRGGHDEYAADNSYDQDKLCHGNGNCLTAMLPEVMDLSPRGIRTHLKLNRPIYSATSSYGHFGRVPDVEGAFPWEKTDLAETLRGAF